MKRNTFADVTATMMNVTHRLVELARVVGRQTGHTSRRHAASQNIHS